MLCAICESFPDAALTIEREQYAKSTNLHDYVDVDMCITASAALEAYNNSIDPTIDTSCIIIASWCSFVPTGPHGFRVDAVLRDTKKPAKPGLHRPGFQVMQSSSVALSALSLSIT